MDRGPVQIVRMTLAARARVGNRLTKLDTKIDVLQQEIEGLRTSVEKLRAEVKKGR